MPFHLGEVVNLLHIEIVETNYLSPVFTAHNLFSTNQDSKDMFMYHDFKSTYFSHF